MNKKVKPQASYRIAFTEAELEAIQEALRTIVTNDCPEDDSAHNAYSKVRKQLALISVNAKQPDYTLVGRKKRQELTVDDIGFVSEVEPVVTSTDLENLDAMLKGLATSKEEVKSFDYVEHKNL